MPLKRRRFTAYPIIVLLLIFVMEVSSVLAAPTDPFNGATPSYSDITKAPQTNATGDWGVADQRGAATYTFPIVVPPGRKGMAPTLALRYSSQSPLRGGIAVGWSLNLPQIERDSSLGYETTPTYRANLGAVAGRLVAVPDVLPPRYTNAYRAEFDSSYTRFFHKAQDEGDGTWLALTTDGVRHYFDHTLSAGSGLPWVITRQEDPFGNVVRYHWSPVYALDNPNRVVELQLDAIEYTENSAAELAAHARILFEYTPFDLCPNSAIPIGAASVGDGQLQGARRLKAISSQVWNETEQWQLRRRVLLAYDTGDGASTVDLDADLEGAHGVEGTIICDHPDGVQSEAPLRYLTYIQEQAWDGNGVKSILPLTAFTYNRRMADHLDETPPVTMNTTSVATYGDRFGTTQTSLDLDSDGVQDRARVVAENGECVMIWQRGQLGGAFGATENRINLPTTHWRDNESNPGAGERCTVNGQVTTRSRTIRTTGGGCHDAIPAIGIVSYHFMDMNGDGRVDVLTNIWAPDGYHDQFLPLTPNTPPDICEASNSRAVGGTPNAIPNPDDPPYLTPLPMEPERLNDQFIWRVYANVGGSNIFQNVSTQTIQSPAVAFKKPDGKPRLNPPSLPPSTSDENVAKGWLSTIPALVDLDGDGIQDFIDVGEDQPRLGSFDGYWSVYFGQGDGTFGPEFRWDLSAVSTMGDNEPIVTLENGRVRTIQETVATLRDLSGDGLPDLVVRAAADGELKMYRNTGTRFSATPVVLGSQGPFEILMTEHDELLLGQDIVNNGERSYRFRMMDVDSDGLLDMVIFAIEPDGMPTEGISGVAYNVGDALVMSHWLPTYWSAAQRNLLVEEGAWRVLTDFVDGDGNGIRDLVQWNETGTEQISHHSGYTTAPRALASVRNLNGLAIDYTYQPSSDPAVVQWAQAPNTWLSSVKWIVSSLSVSAGNGAPTMIQHYQYADPAYQSSMEYTDVPEPSTFLGFRETTQIAEGQGDAPNKKVVRRYAYDTAGDPNGRMVEEWVYNGNPSGQNGYTLHQYRKQRWAWKALFNLKLYASVLEEEITRTCLTEATVANCMTQSENVHRHHAVWEAYPDATMPQLYFQRSVQEGSGLTVGAADRRVEKDYEIRYGQPPFTDSDYRLLTIKEQLLAAVDNNGALTFVPIKRTTTKYDTATGLPIQSNQWQDGGTVATTVNVFDPATGNLVSQTQPNEVAGSGLSRSYTYDAHQLHRASMTNELGYTIYYTYDLAQGKAVAQRGPNAVTQGGNVYWERETWHYDGFGRLLQHHVSADDPVSGQPHQLYPVEQFQYFDFETPQRVQIEKAIDFDGALWGTTVRTIDGMGRQLTEEELLENGDKAVTTYGYDSRGNRTTVTTPDPRVDDGSTVTYRYHFDGLGRVVGFDQPDGNGVVVNYAGLEKTIADVTADGSGGRHTEVQDVFGQLIAVYEENAETGPAATHYTYDANGYITTITDADGNVTTIDYDWVGNRVAITRGNRQWRYRYDLQNNMISEHSPVPAGDDPIFYTIERSYDVLNRITSVTYADPLIEAVPLVNSSSAAAATIVTTTVTAPAANQIFLPIIVDESAPTAHAQGDLALVTAAAAVDKNFVTIEYSYDQGENGIGRLSHIEAPAATLEYAIDYGYDARGQIRHEERSIQVPGGIADLVTSQAVERTYNALGQMVESSWDDGQRWRLAYDRRGMIRTVEWFDSNRGLWQAVAAYSRSTMGQVRSRTSDYNQTRVFEYDLGGHVAHDTVTVNGLLVAERNYTFNDVENVIAITGQTNGVDAGAQFTYDQQRRLRTAMAPNGYVGTFTYSQAGNLQTADVDWQGTAHKRNVQYVYGAIDPQAVDQLVDQSSGNSYASFSYDPAGNMVSRSGPDGAMQLTWDGLDRVRMIESPNGTEVYYYDQDGNRMLAVNSQGSVRFWFDERETHYTADGSPQQSYLHLADGKGTIARIENGKEVELQYADMLQNLMLSVNGQGQVVSHFFYGPFGEVVQESGAANHRRQFNGKENDQISGLRYYGFRYYDPLILRWNSADPLYRFMPDVGYREPQRMNLYAFSLNNPVRYLDPDGRDSKNEWVRFGTKVADKGLGAYFEVGGILKASDDLKSYHAASERGRQGIRPEKTNLSIENNIQEVTALSTLRNAQMDAVSNHKKRGTLRQQKTRSQLRKIHRNASNNASYMQQKIDAVDYRIDNIWKESQPLREKYSKGELTEEEEKLFNKMEAEYEQLLDEKSALEDELQLQEDWLRELEKLMSQE